ncbi:MAG: endonuclease/exonuclease/phosphatase family protein [Patescibacteria group bacterium]
MKLLQWNIWYKEDIRNVLKLLREVNADVICLQELTINHPHYNQRMNTAQFIAEGLGFHYHFKEAQSGIVDGVEEKYGNGIFSRYPILKTNHVYIQDPLDPYVENTDYDKEGRIYVEIAVNVGGRELTVGTVHMSYTHKFEPNEAKKVETNKLVEVLKSKKDNFIITGDFNSLPDSYTITEIEKYLKNLGPAQTENTWTTKPFSYNGFEVNSLDWRLDYCFATPDVQTVSAKILETAYSDHLPILIEI